MSVGEDRFLLLASVLGELGLRNGCKDCTNGTTHTQQLQSLHVCRTSVRRKVCQGSERDREGGRAQILSCLRGFGLYGWRLGVCGESGVFWGF